MRLFLIFLGCIFPAMAMAQLDSLRAYLAQKEAEGLQISLLAQRADGSVFFAQQADKQIPSASVIKIPILFRLMEEVSLKELKLNQLHRLEQADIVGGSGDLQFEAPGKMLSYDELAAAMIRTSDNTATNIVINRLGLENINAMLLHRGFQQTQLQRKMMDFEAIKAGRQNYTTPREINRMLHLLLTKQWLPDKQGKKALEYLLACNDKTTIPRLLPPTLPIAHKTGTLDYVRADAAIIFTPSPLILSVFVENFQSLEQAELIIAKIARYVVESN